MEQWMHREWMELNHLNIHCAEIPQYNDMNEEETLLEKGLSNYPEKSS